MKFHILEAAFRKQFYKEIGGKNIYIVDGEFIRTHLNAEFTNWAQHFRFPELIPEKEIWVDEEKEPGELNYFITAASTEYDKMAAGENYGKAHIQATEVEKNQREKKMLKKDDVRIKLWKKLPKSGLKIYVVDGEAVRDQLNVDFTEGGHSLRYDFIPRKEIWIDNDVAPKERKYILAHEIFELGAMQKNGGDYDKAHKAASKYEKELRKENSNKS